MEGFSGLVADIGACAVPDREEGFEDAADLVRLYGEILSGFGLSGSPAEVDREDWIEAACRLVAAHDAADANGLEFVVASRPAGLRRARGMTDPPGRLVAMGPFSRLLAMEMRQAGLDVRDPFNEPVDYAVNPAFVRYAGRRFVTCRNDSDGDGALPTLEEAVAGFMGREVVWKMLGEPLKEYPLERFVPDADEPIPEDIRWAAVHRSGGTSCLQDRVPMLFEYRVMVVDGAVVSGAGMVMEHTPLDRPTGLRGPFSPLARSDIRSREPAVAAPALATYAAMAQDMADDLIREGGEAFPRNFAMDLFAADASPEASVGIVELNPLGRSGLFANDVAATFAAMARASVAGPRPGPSP